MDALPDFHVLNPVTLAEALAARAAHPESRPLGGGTDLVVNIRRGIVAPPVLIDLNRVPELSTLHADATVARHRRLGQADRARRASGGGAALSGAGAGRLPSSPARPSATWARSAAISASTRAASSTIRANGGASANHHCLKTTGTICHVAPKSRGVCFATFAGDLAPALLTLSAEVDIAGPAGKRSIPLNKLYIGFARQDVPVSETQATASSICRCARRDRHRGAREEHAPACARATTRSASASRSNIRWPASR